MSHRMFLALALSTALVGNACAAENAEATSNEATQVAGAVAAEFSAPDEAWRTVDPENLMVIDTKYGKIGVELYPEIAPKHVAQVKALTRQDFYNDVVFHRVIDGFMNQTGDGSEGNGTGNSELPDIEGEFTFKRGLDMPFTMVSAKKSGKGEIGVGFYKSLPIASQPSSQAMFTKDGKVDAFGLHCKGVTSMARASDPNSANSQFFLMRAEYASLDTKYSIWGNTVMGYEFLESPQVGVIGEVPGWIPDRMNEVKIASDMPEAERPTVEVLKTDHPAFKNWLRTQKNEDGTFPSVCELNVPTRLR